MNTPSRITGDRRVWLTRSRKVWIGSLAMGLLAGFAAIGLDRVDRMLQRNQVEALSLSAYDVALYQRRPEPALPGTLVRDHHVVLVQITDRTITALSDAGLIGQGATLPRRLHAQLLDRLREMGARVVAFDMVFTPETADDSALVLAMRRMKGRVVVGARPTAELDYTGSGSAANELRSYVNSVPAIREAGETGLVLLPQDVDQSIRRFQWYDVTLNDDAEEQKQLALAPAACALYLGRSTPEAAAEVDRGRFCGAPIKTFAGVRTAEARVGQGQAPPTSLIDFLGGPSEGFQTFSYEDVLASEELARQGRSDFAAIRDKLVIVGDTSQISQDIHKTPYYSSKLRTSNRPGLEIQANVAHTILANHYIGRASAAFEWWLVILTGIGVALVTRKLNAIAGFLFTALVIGGLVVGAGVSLASAFTVFDPIRPGVAAALAFALEMVLLQLSERRQQRELRTVFGRLVDPAVVQEIIREDRPPQLGGEERQVTLLFSDLQGFTTLSEQLSAPDLVRILNRYFDVMLGVIFRHGGTLDKLMGDGIMAYWGAPKDEPRHAARALACAREMQTALDQFRKAPENASFAALKMRIGLHTGVAVVGLIGSRDRESYTLTGDVVNCAARLEGLNKEFGTSILMSEDTFRAARPDVAVVEHGEHRVKGRNRPIRVFSIAEGVAPRSGGAASSGPELRLNGSKDLPIAPDDGRRHQEK